MWCSHQTLLHRETKKLWILANASKSDWAWLLEDEQKMINEHGETKGFPSKQLTKLFATIHDEFGTPMTGRPQWDKDNNVIGLDASLYKFVDVSEEEKEKRRKELLDRAIISTIKRAKAIKDLSGDPAYPTLCSRPRIKIMEEESIFDANYALRHYFWPRFNDLPEVQHFSLLGEDYYILFGNKLFVQYSLHWLEKVLFNKDQISDLQRFAQCIVDGKVSLDLFKPLKSVDSTK